MVSAITKLTFWSRLQTQESYRRDQRTDRAITNSSPPAVCVWGLRRRAQVEINAGRYVHEWNLCRHRHKYL